MPKATIVELRRRAAAGIFAIPYGRGRRRKAVILPDGAIVEVPTAEGRRQAPERPEPALGIATDGAPATVHHANLGLVAGYVLLEGVYLLPTGEVAAIYNAEAVPIGAGTSDAPRRRR